MSILIVGGAGYIGSQTAKAVATAGLEPVVFDNLVYGHEWAVKWGPLVRGDLADRALLVDVMKRHQVDAVIHFAAYAYVGESVTNPRKYFGNNVAGSLNLLDAMLDAGVRDVVFSSTCATYGEPQRVPIAEDHPQNPVNPYGETKLAVEKMLHWYSRAYEIRYAALRYFNAAGAAATGDLGEDHEPESHLIPLVLAAALGRKPNITILGNDYPTKDGTCVRDYIHVEDLADAHVRALDHLDRGGAGGAFNLGTGDGYTVREVIDLARKVAGRAIPEKLGKRRPGDPAVLVADGRKAKETLGWIPKHSDLETIVSSAWRWHEKHPAGYGDRPAHGDRQSRGGGQSRGGDGAK